jgi:hypothetical protein
MWRRAVAVALVWAAPACAPALPSISQTEARAVLERFAAGQAPVDVCEPEGRALFRGAVRSYARAMAESGQPWPNISTLGEGDSAGPTGIDVMVLGALGAGFIEPNDIRGPTRILARHIARAYNADLSDVRRAVEIACPEVVEMQQVLARAYIEDQRFEARMARERDRRSERVERYARRHVERMIQVRDHVYRLKAEIEAKLEAAA